MGDRKQSFGEYLRGLRVHAGYGLRRFAGLIEIKPSNLCDIEYGRRAMPATYLESTAEALSIQRGSPQWQKFFKLASAPGELPADLQQVAQRPFVPALLRTIDNQQLSEADVKKLIEACLVRGKKGNAPK